MHQIEELQKKYSKLPPQERQIIGEALVKVNLGVASTSDLVRAASFLKGTGYIAKVGKLGAVLDILSGLPQESGPVLNDADQTKTS